MMLFGQDMTDQQVCEVISHTKSKAELEKVLSAVRVQKKLEAKKRIINETDLDKKEIMQNLYNEGQYDFDALFGKN